MGKNLKGKECGNGICQRKDGRYCARFVDRMVSAAIIILHRFQRLGIGLQMHSMRIGTELSLHPLI